MPTDLVTPAGRDELRRKIADGNMIVRADDAGALARDCLALLDQADAANKLQRFKDWVHTYLDAKGIPHRPPGTHGAEGCRIGNRMDYVFAKLDAGAALAQRVIRAARLLGIANSDTEPNAAETQMLVDDILTRCAALADAGERDRETLKAIAELVQDLCQRFPLVRQVLEQVTGVVPPPPARAAAAGVAAGEK
jgi:hypothetical protein